MRPRVGRRRGRRHPLWLLRVGASRQGCGPFAEVSRENIAEQQRKTYVISDNLLPMALVFGEHPPRRVAVDARCRAEAAGTLRAVGTVKVVLNAGVVEDAGTE